jgi:hypothetical protein
VEELEDFVDIAVHEDRHTRFEVVRGYGCHP